MRRGFTTSLLLIAIFVALIRSYVHLFGDLLLPYATLDGDDAGAPPPPPAAFPLNANLTQPLSHRPNFAVRELLRHPSARLSPPPPESILFPDWETLLVLPLHSAAIASAGNHRNLSCLFHNGAVSPAGFVGTLPTSPARAAFRCPIPSSIRRLRAFYTPRLIDPAAAAAAPESDGHDPQSEMIRWTRLAYEAVSTPTDIVVFAKGVNTRLGVNRPPSDLRCLFSSYASGDDAPVAATPAASSAQEVFRCPHPAATAIAAKSRTGEALRVSLEIAAEGIQIPSLANYPWPPVARRTTEGRALICACTMVRNVAKFLAEWIVYHSAIGVERFFLYDNGSDDGLHSVVGRLASDGFNISTRFWPWPKTQEAGFSHCATVNRDTCTWMAFIDVDEFIFSPAWAGSELPNRTMLGSLVAVRRNVGQVSMRCFDFGPSGLRAHPRDGVTQGYTCRRRKLERHKSLVRLDAVDDSLVNSVHHFELKTGFGTRRTGVSAARVYHYKYQAWEEFKVKFRRRVSAYTVDWTETVKLRSKDRTPGLGFEPVEPKGWANRFCEVKDSRLRDVNRKWFRVEGPNEDFRMAWEWDGRRERTRERERDSFS
ncbi:LOW QUALITY PROTEIN: glycosyltransferase family 92 protein RCOM_0530710-like [Phoenix dactylifera]|uniref:Glycosyltransferase family 92 protein n=1 Tax=Phoenix dactylifera TaxID=42345 RepID=A0A8B8J0V5_PHODC|nr:LOW QUALITY PROTEIN: glycosyltransferase family 92 protein RCOM_0530710-like [Phoenix dactylifera]